MREVVLPTLTFGIPACKKNVSVIVLSIIGINLIRVGGQELRASAPTSTVDDDADEHHSRDCLLG